MDYISLIHQFIDPIVTDLDKLTITEEKGEKEKTDAAVKMLSASRRI